MLLSARDVAFELRRRLPHLGVTQVHKLLYYCQGWSLAFLGRPMFGETIRAYPFGPVVADLWREEKYANQQAVEPKPIPSEDAPIVSYVANRYGHFSAARLSEMTHNEAPWKDVSEQDSEWSTSDDDIISVERIRDYFAGLEEVVTARELMSTHRWDVEPRIPDGYRGSARDDPTRIQQRIRELRR